MPKHHLRPQLAAVAVGTVVFALVGVGTLAIGHGGQTRGRHIRCGQQIRRDRTLHRDFHNCPNKGIVIKADGVTLDLNGHTIDGNAKPVKHCHRHAICDVGVFNRGHDGVTVRHGSVREFRFGVQVGTPVRTTRHNRFLRISSSRNVFGGFFFFRAAQSVVRNSSGSGSITPEGGTGIYLVASRHVRILHSSFRNNGDRGLGVFDSTRNLIKGNLISRNKGGGGIVLEGSDRNRVRGNRCVRNGSCVLVAPGNRNVIARNRIFRPDAGIGIEKGRGNLVERNVITDAHQAGIYLALNAPPVGSDHNVLRRNLVKRSGDDGFLVRPKDDHSVLRHNVARNNGDDGFDVRSRSTKLTRNRAVRNAKLGIRAVPGVIDGGGNEASGNGDPRQCVNIVCR